MTHVLGIDVSSHAVDLVKLDENTNHATWTRISLEGASAYDRLCTVPDAMPLRSSFYDNVYLIGIETPKTRFMNSAAALLPVYGAVIASLPRNMLARGLVWDVHPKTWRGALGLSGAASKDDVKRAVLALEPTIKHHIDANWLPQDAYDAYAVALYCRETNRRAVEAAA